jgi:hypothetical protein
LLQNEELKAVSDQQALEIEDYEAQRQVSSAAVDGMQCKLTDQQHGPLYHSSCTHVAY